MKNIHLDDWQKEILNHDGNLLLCTGRQVGKTTIFAIKSVEYMIKHPNTQILVVSLTEDQAKLIISMMLSYAEEHYKKQIAKGKNKPTQTRIAFTNKSRAIARPVGITGDSVRGFTGDILIIDEASRMNEMTFTSAKPTLLTTEGKIWMCSTPHGKQGYFYESYQNKNNRFKVFHISSEKVIKERPITDTWTKAQSDAAKQFLEEEKRDMTELQYGQEYLGLFLEDLRQFFPDELLSIICILKRPDTINHKHPKYMGVDIARLGDDETAYAILEEKQDKAFQIENQAMKKQLTTQTEANILRFNNIYNLKKIGIDAGSGSLGVGIFDRLITNPITRRKTISMNNRAISLDRDGKHKQRIFKEDMYDNLLGMMEKKEILLLDDDAIFTSLKSVQWELKKVAGLTKVKIFGNYTHIAEALVRAAWLFKKEKHKNFNIYYI